MATTWSPPPNFGEPITTPRLVLRQYTEDDAQALFDAVNLSRQALLPWMPWANDAHKVPAESLEWIRTTNQARRDDPHAGLNLAMIDRVSGELVGATGLPRFDPAVAQGEIGYWVRADRHRQGLATEATRHLISASFAAWGLNRIVILCDGGNTASRGVPAKLGLRRELRLRQARRNVDGELADELGWGVLAEEWDTGNHRLKDAEPEHEVGVGPHPQPWPTDARYDENLLAHGDKRNVADRYRYWRLEAIRADLARKSAPFHVAIENWRHDLNIGTVVRNANAFGARSVHVVGRRQWNRRGAMVTDRYLDVHHHDDVAGLLGWAADGDLPVIGVDNLPGSTSILEATLPQACVLTFGQEGPGLSPTLREAAVQILHIPQVGSTRSINAGVASGIAMALWHAQHAITMPAE